MGKQGNKPGAHARHPKYNKALHGQIVRDVRAGHFLKVAAARAGVAATTIRMWRKMGEGLQGSPEQQARYRQFYLDLTRAEADSEAAALALWVGVAEEGVLETVTTQRTVEAPDGTTTTTETKTTHRPEWRACAELLRRRYAARWEPRQVLEHEGTMEKHVFIHDGPAPRAPTDEEEEDA
jgi:hypothetical protein